MCTHVDPNKKFNYGKGTMNQARTIFCTAIWNIYRFWLVLPKIQSPRVETLL